MKTLARLKTELLAMRYEKQQKDVQADERKNNQF